MLKRVNPAIAPEVLIRFEGEPLRGHEGQSIAETLLEAGVRTTRRTPVTDSARAPYCMMGVCFDCLVVVDGMPNQQACMIPIRDGMEVARQQGAADPLAFDKCEKGNAK